MYRIEQPSKPHWRGPYEDGITQSLITKFLECPFRSYLYFICGLEEPDELHPNLIWGDTYHYGLEQILKHTCLMADFTPGDWQTIDDKVEEYLDKNYPQAPGTFIHSILGMLRMYNDEWRDGMVIMPEQKFKEQYVSYDAIKTPVILRGKLDGLSTDGNTMVEHKCKGRLGGQQGRDETELDNQVNIYAMVSGARNIIYDIIRIPDTQWSKPPKRQMQRAKSYAEDLLYNKHWGDFPVVDKPALWFEQFPVYLDDTMINHWRMWTLDPLIQRICRWWEHVTDPNFDLDNPRCYNDVFYVTPIRHFDPSQTERYKCSYHSFLTGELEVESLSPVKSFYSELEDEDDD